MESLKRYFEVEVIKEKSYFFLLLEKENLAEHFFGMYKDKRYWLLRLKNVKILDKEMADYPQEYRLIGAAILNQLVFKNILNLDPAKENIIYSPHAEELIKEVDTQPNCLAFFLRPVKIEDIMAISLKGNKMPPKTTYFYPKLLSGLVIHQHEEI